jgi:hypothetical protein
MRKLQFNDEFLVLLGPIISRLFTCSNEGKEPKGACSSPISMLQLGPSFFKIAKNFFFLLQRLPDKIREKDEKLKEEMLGELLTPLF